MISLFPLITFAILQILHLYRGEAQQPSHYLPWDTIDNTDVERYYKAGKSEIFPIKGYRGTLRCPKAGTHLFPHEGSCVEVVRCDDGVPAVGYCSKLGYLEYNDEHKACLLANHSRCAVLARWRSGFHSFKCPNSGSRNHSSGTLYCQVYFECKEGDITIHRCPEPTAFNNKTGQCDIESEARCFYSQFRAKGLEKKPTPNPRVLMAPPAQVTGPPACKPPPEDPKARRLTENLPVLRDCRSYYNCANEDGPRYEVCPYGQEFYAPFRYCVDTARRVCMFQDIDYVCPEKEGLFPNDLDCHSFYHCSGGNPFIKPCPGGLAFNRERKVCDRPDETCPPFRYTDATEYFSPQEETLAFTPNEV